MRNNRIFNATFLITLGTFLIAPAATASVFEVDIENFAFAPDTLTICVGDTVRWTNLDGAPHTATSDTGIWDSGILNNGDQFEFTFTAPGSFPYLCTLHPSMTATIHVDANCTLSADSETISAGGGGVVTFSLDAGAANANRNYILAGSTTGTVPGTLLPGGLATIPLIKDNFTNIVLNNLNTPTFSNFRGKLDGSGTATAQLVRNSLPASFVGKTMYYAYALRNPFNFSSNAVAVQVLP